MLIISVLVTFDGRWALCPKLGLDVETSDFTHSQTSCEETHYLQSLDLGCKRNRLLRKVWSVSIRHGKHPELALWLQSKHSWKWTFENCESAQKKKQPGILLSLYWSIAEGTRKDSGLTAQLPHTHQEHKREAPLWEVCKWACQPVHRKAIELLLISRGWKSFHEEKSFQVNRYVIECVVPYYTITRGRECL